MTSTINFLVFKSCVDLFRAKISKRSNTLHVTNRMHRLVTKGPQNYDVLIKCRKYELFRVIRQQQFVFDLMVCGRMNMNKCMEEFVLVSPAPVDTAAKLARNYQLQVPSLKVFSFIHSHKMRTVIMEI